MSTAYVLEAEAEFDRLERQSREAEYDFQRELAGLKVADGARVLDAGCGSGIVTRHLARTWPRATILGCDSSPQRIEQARSAAAGAANAEFRVEDLLNLTLPSESFDAIVCRYVLQHIRHEPQKAVSELARCLKRGGTLHLIDGDGIFVNLHPLPPEAAAALKAIEERAVDLHCGRKLPALMHAAGLVDLQVTPRTFHFSGEALEREVGRMRERLTLAASALGEIVGGELQYRRFMKSYLDALQAPGSCYFHAIFVVEGVKR